MKPRLPATSNLFYPEPETESSRNAKKSKNFKLHGRPQPEHCCAGRAAGTGLLHIGIPGTLPAARVPLPGTLVRRQPGAVAALEPAPAAPAGGGAAGDVALGGRNGFSNGLRQSVGRTRVSRRQPGGVFWGGLKHPVFQPYGLGGAGLGGSLCADRPGAYLFHRP